MRSILKKSSNLLRCDTMRAGGPKHGVASPHSFSAVNSFYNEGYKNHPEEMYS